MARVRVLSIAGSDPSGGAGIQADLAVFGAFECHGMAVVTALTVQNSCGVTAALPTPAEFVERQLAALIADRPPSAVKTGMLSSADIVRVIVDAFAGRPEIPLVVDPVTVSGDGARLVDLGAERELISSLVPIAGVVTPNAVEAATMTGLQVLDVDGAVAAARRLTTLGARAAVVKGGHVAGADVIDVLVEAGGEPVLFSRPRIASPRRVHGTGCAFSAALAASLARGTPLESAVRVAGDFVHAAIAAAYVVGAGAMTLDFVAGRAGIPR